MLLKICGEKELKNVKQILFALDGKLDIIFNDGTKPKTIQVAWAMSISEQVEDGETK